MKYRKRPVVIEAVLWDGNKLVGGAPPWMVAALNNPCGPDDAGWVMRMGNTVHIGTKEGVMKASPGDYIIQGIKGELYPCKPDIFAETYEGAE